MPARLEGVEGVKRALREKAERMKKAYVRDLNMIGTKVVKAIRESDVSYWMDQTGNLRNSIGYILLDDGRRIGENFAEVNPGGKEGMAQAKAFADELQAQYPSGYVLIIVAGMEYAAYVEAIESREVLTGGEKLAKRLVKEINAKWESKYGRK